MRTVDTAIDQHAKYIPSDRTGTDRKSARRTSCSTVAAFGSALGLLVLEAAGFLAFALNHVDLATYATLHINLTVIATIIGFWWVTVGGSPTEVRSRIVVVLQLAAWTALGGPFGVAVAAAQLTPQVGRKNSVPPSSPQAQQSAITVRDRPEVVHSALLDQRLRLTQAHQTRPLLDVVLEGTLAEKFDALGAMSRRFGPALAPALKAALEDPEAAVRVLAATVIAKQHRAYADRIGRLNALAKVGSNKPQHIGELAQAHLDYARCGLLDGSRADEELRQADSLRAGAEQLAKSSSATINDRIAYHGT